MGQKVDVQVLDGDGNPVTGVRVEVFIPGFWKGGSLYEYTDDQGHAEFETEGDYESGREVKICVRGEWFGPYDLEDGAFTVTLD